MPSATDIVARAAEALRRGLPSGGRAAISELPGASAAVAALALAKIEPGCDIVAVVSGVDDAETLFADMRTFDDGEEPLLLYPPSDGEMADVDREGERVEVARYLLAGRRRENEGRVLIATATALLMPLVDPDAVAEAGVKFRKGECGVPFGELAGRFTKVGYERVSEVVAKGQVAIRGGLIDIWPATEPLPVRLDFFGDEVETIRQFDPASQRSGEHLVELWAPPFNVKGLATSRPLDMLPRGSVFFVPCHDEVAASAMRPGDETPTPAAWAKIEEAVAKSEPRLVVYSGEPPPEGVPMADVAVASPPSLADVCDGPVSDDFRAEERRKLLLRLAGSVADGWEVSIYTDTAAGMEWLGHELPPRSGISVALGVVSSGFEWPALKTIVLGQSDVYAVRRHSSRATVRTKVANRGGRIERASEIAPGDLVVCIDHGIARYEGTREVVSDGRRQEMMELVFADDVKLFLPVTQAHLLSRYVGVAGKGVKLSRLGGTKWRNDSIKAEKSIVDYAAQLLELQARRKAAPGFAFEVDNPMVVSFEAAFPHKETPDQLTCIAAVKRDMADAKPMDRLICGDAGYGKTEVAMRAAFIAVASGKQVAVLAPTTVLAEQHFATFRDRMAAFPVRIEALSRLRSHSERDATLRAAANGRVDIVIGTHAIVGADVAFKDLGLVIIDEEQRFGVMQKEALKRLRASVDVLTLSATPIPRTLYMSMVGARDMSLIQTPPQDRLAIETKIERDRDDVIRRAVLREINRGGQVFFLHNRVITIDIVRRRLERLLPEVRIGVAHGQLPPGQLSRVMREFEKGAFDVLLCTTIIESGLDIPRANTIVVNRADRFGLAELYQLRGRVGRSSKRGFALLLIPEQGVLDGDARMRIAALKRHGGLGGGLNLALRDLEIRGAGNMLGAEQSGHIAAIGFNLYCQLLRRTVARMKGENPPPIVDVELEFDFIALSPGDEAGNAACLPYGYVEDEDQRMKLHRRIAEASTPREVRDLAAEIAERFGKMPPEATRMMRMAEMRTIAAVKGLVRITARDGVIRAYRRDNQPVTLADGRLPRLAGETIDQKLTALMKFVSNCKG